MAEEKVVESQEVDLTGGDRAEIYKRYQQQAGPEPVKAEEKPAEEPEKKPDEKPEPEAKEPEKPKEDHDENLKRALQEEREKRKRLAKEKEELQKRIEEYGRKPEPKPEDDTIVDYEAELKVARKKIVELEGAVKNIVTDKEQEKYREAIKTRDMNIAKVDEELGKAGFPGFKMLVGSVRDELVRLVNEDDENRSLDNPEGWMKIYKENIYPKAADAFKSVERKKVEEAKKDAKRGLGLAPSPGKKEVPDVKPEDEMTMAGYLQRRKTIT